MFWFSPLRNGCAPLPPGRCEKNVRNCTLRYAIITAPRPQGAVIDWRPNRKSVRMRAIEARVQLNGTRHRNVKMSRERDVNHLMRRCLLRSAAVIVVVFVLAGT